MVTGCEVRICQRDSQSHPCGIVVSQQIGTRVARFERYHCLLCCYDLVENSESVNRPLQ